MKRSATNVVSKDTYPMYCVINIIMIVVGMVKGRQKYQ